MKAVSRTVTQADIARALGISQSTVGLVVGHCTSQRGKEKLRPETIERIERKAKEMGYRPDRHAQIMRQGKTTSIGMIYAGGIMQVANERTFCVAQALKERGYDLLPFDVQWTVGRHTEAMEHMLDAKVAGILLSTSYIDPEELPTLKRVRTPMVGLSAFEAEGMAQVRCDMRAGMRKITDHLLTEGHRRLVQLSNSADPEVPHTSWVWQQARQTDGFRSALHAAGGSHRICSLAEYSRWLRHSKNDPLPNGVTLCIPKEFKRTASRWNPYFYGSIFAQSLLGETAGLPDAILCPNDDWAFGFANEAMRAGLSIPQQLAITGFNASTLAETFCVPFTTVRQPTKEMCELAVSLLVDRIEGGNARSRVHDLPGELLVRASSRRLPC